MSWNGKTVTQFEGKADITDQAHVSRSYTDRQGRVWIGTALPAGVAVYDKGTFRAFGTNEGLTPWHRAVDHSRTRRAHLVQHVRRVSAAFQNGSTSRPSPRPTHRWRTSCPSSSRMSMATSGWASTRAPPSSGSIRREVDKVAANPSLPARIRAVRRDRRHAAGLADLAERGRRRARRRRPPVGRDRSRA